MSKQNEHVIWVSLDAVREIPVRDLAIRFAFGAAISATAAVISYGFGARVGGLFLAFPAILPATLTLIEKEQSKHKAESDDVGAVLGATALILFAALAWWLIPTIGAPAAILVAVVGWMSSALLLYVILRAASGGRFS